MKAAWNVQRSPSSIGEWFAPDQQYIYINGTMPLKHLGTQGILAASLTGNSLDWEENSAAHHGGVGSLPGPERKVSTELWRWGAQQGCRSLKHDGSGEWGQTDPDGLVPRITAL